MFEQCAVFGPGLDEGMPQWVEGAVGPEWVGQSHDGAMITGITTEYGPHYECNRAGHALPSFFD